MSLAEQVRVTMVSEEPQIQLGNLAAQRSLFETARMAAHDIRSPLTALNSLSCLPNLSQRERNLIRRISERITSIAEDLLSRAKPLDVFTTNQIHSADSLIEMIREIIDETKLCLKQEDSIELVCTDELETTALSINRVDLGRAICNLIQNGIDACGDTPVNLKIKVKVTGNGLSILVQDNGIGIPYALRKRIFCQGFTSKKDGNGLGLSRSADTLAKWGASLNLLHSSNAGSTFSINLPIVTACDQVSL